MNSFFLKKGRLLPEPAALVLICAFILSFVLKLSLIKIGSPFITIDDNTAFEGGFLVWFGQAPPQRMYLESWVNGISSIATYIVKMLMSGNSGVIGINLIADAYRDFYGQPDTYVHVYRQIMIIVDMMTAGMVFVVSRKVLDTRWNGWAAVLPAVMYLFSYNTFWCDVVARPDTLVAFFGVLGLYFYFKSDFGQWLGWFLMSSVALGLAAGMKLHGSFFAIFIVFDLLRVHGFKKAFGKVFCLTVVSFFFFCFATGSLFADPLTYIKLRMMNVKDDVSPWLQWGDQFIALLRGSGWLVIPGVVGAALITFRKRFRADNYDQMVVSVIFQSVCWLILFSVIRQLRAYWILPVLPLFYISAVYALSLLKKKQLVSALTFASVLIIAGQSYSQVRELKQVDFNQLRNWVQINTVDKPFYILGFEALILPKNTLCISNRVAGLKKGIETSLTEGLPYTLRHLKNWEERSGLVLFDMLGNKYESGYEYYGLYSTPLDLYRDIFSLDDMSFIFVQENFSSNISLELKSYIHANFIFVTELSGAGGGGSGMKTKIYERINDETK